MSSRPSTSSASGSMRLHLRKFDMSQIKDDSVVVMIGKRNTGKSWLVKDLLYNKRDMPIGTVVSPTESYNKFFGSIVPPVFIHDEVTPDLLNNVVRRQKLLIKKVDKQKQVYGSCNIDPRAFLLLDDCMYDQSFIKDKNIRFMLMNGRHIDIMFIITQQYALGMPPSLRTQVDFIFILRENYIQNRRRIYESYAGMFPSFDIFCQVMDQCTENFECLVINNMSRSNKLTDQVFWYKAEPRPAFTIGAAPFWALSKDCEKHSAITALPGMDGSAMDDEDDEPQMYDISHLAKTKKGPSISVRKGVM